jgi:hypothetical protein
MNDNNNSANVMRIPPEYVSDNGEVNIDRMILDLIAVTKIGRFTEEALQKRIEHLWSTVEVFSGPVGNA